MIFVFLWLISTWQFLTKLNRVSPYDPAITLLCMYQIDLKTYPCKSLIEVFCFFFPELPRWLGQQIVIQPYNGRLFSDKNKWTLQPWKDMEEISIHVDRWMKPIWKGYPPYGSSSMISRKRQNFRERKRISGCQELSEGKGGMCRWNTGAFKGLKSTVMVGTWSYGVVKTWRLSTESKAWCTQI